jgi:proline dehydrogenase
MDAVGSEDAVRKIVAHAKEREVEVTCDMEDRHWTDWTLDLVNQLWDEGNKHLGTVLQTRLNRTEADLERIPVGMRVRMVIGIYLEPAEHATQDKREMKERLLQQSKILLERGNYVEFATHDEPYVRRFLEDIVPSTGVGSDRFEVQLLYGVPRDKLVKELLAGKVGSCGPVKVRLYVPFATSWKHAVAYCRRRLMENPSMASAVTRNILRVMTGRR